MKEISIIGQGSWGKKISSILSQSNEYLVEDFSSRKIMEDLHFISRPSGIVWIAARPESQKILLKLIEAKTIILEKPFLSKIFEFKNWNIDIPSNYYFSLPWNFSKMWSEIKPTLLAGQEWEIEIQRSGPIRRSYMTPIADWLPHDLGLISEVWGFCKMDVLDKIDLKCDFDNLRLFINSKISINWRGGYTPTKIGQWKISNAQQSIELDFINNQTTHRISKSITKIIKYDDSPIVTMLNQIADRKSFASLDSQLAFYQKVFV